MGWLVAVTIIVGVVLAVVALWRGRLREQKRCFVHGQRLRSMLLRASHGDLDALRQYAQTCHEAGPSPVAAEAWFALGCALLDDRQPEEATRAFQIACHTHPGLESATLLAFACLKTRASDMGEFLRIVVETYSEIGQPRIPGSAWEREVLAAIHMPDMTARGLSALARSLSWIPIRVLGEQMRDAAAARAPWAASLFVETPVRPNGGRRIAPA